MRHPRFTGMALSVLVLIVAPIAACGSGSSTNTSGPISLTIGSDNRLGGQLLAEMYSLLLAKNKGFNVTTTSPYDANTLRTLIQVGNVDLYPEFTGTVRDTPPNTTPQQAYGTAKGLDAGKGLTLLAPAYSLSFSYGYCTSQANATKYHLQSIGDLAAVSSKLKRSSLQQDNVYYLYVDQMYGLHWNSTTVISGPASFTEVTKGTIDVNECYTTDPNIVVDNFVLLTDTKNVFPPGNVAPVVRDSTLKKSSAIQTTLDALESHLTTHKMTTLIKQASVDNWEVPIVAKAFLQLEGLLPYATPALPGCTNTFASTSTVASANTRATGLPGGGFDARPVSLSLPRTHPSSGMDSGYSVIQDPGSVLVGGIGGENTPKQGVIPNQGAFLTEYAGLGASGARHSMETPTQAINCGKVSVSCPSGQQMLGGGYSTDVVAGNLYVVASYPSNSNTWTVVGVNGTPDIHIVTAYVDCAAPNGSPQDLGMMVYGPGEPGASVPVEPGSPPASAIATCSTGLATGGGFMLSGSAANVIASQPVIDGATNKWTATAYNTSSSSVTESVYVMCETTSAYSVSIQSSLFTVASNSRGQGTIPESTCQAVESDYKITGGGFSTTDIGAYTTMFFQLDNGMAGSGALTQWDVAAFNNDSTSHSATVYAVCV